MSSTPDSSAPTPLANAAPPSEALVRRRQRRGGAELVTVDLEAVAGSARAYAKAARSERTLQEYASQWHTFSTWCAERGLDALPAAPATLALYLTDRADGGIKSSSLQVALAAIASHHARARIARELQPQRHAEVAEVWRGIRRRKGTAPRRVAPLVVDELRAMLEALPTTLAGKRDRALLVVGFAGAFRRAELVALDVSDLKFTRKGLVVTVRRSKTDQAGAGTAIGIPYGSSPHTCPVRLLKVWLAASGVTSGAVFRSVNRHGQLGEALSGRDVARIVQRSAATAGLDASLYSGHSLRAGLATSAAQSGKADREIMKQGRWRGRAMLDRYIRDARLLEAENAAAGIGL